MTDPRILFRAQVAAIADEIVEEFDREPLAMSRRRAANGSFRSGAMLIDIADGIKGGFVALRDKAEATVTAAWGHSLWVSAADEQGMLADLGAQFDRINAHGLATLREHAARIAAPAGVLPELEPGVQQRLNECKERMVLTCELQRRAHDVSKVKRGLGLAGSAVGAAFKWVVGLASK